MSGLAVGRVVHYVTRGSADGEYPPMHVAAIVTWVHDTDQNGYVDLFTMYRTGTRFELNVLHDEAGTPGTWHWPERDS